MNDAKLGRSAIALIGLAVVFLIVILINTLGGLLGGARIDLTENKVFTLSPGTKNILNRLETPVTVRYYATDDGDVMSPNELARAKRIKERLDEFVRAAPKKVVELSNPKTGKFEKKKIRMLQVEKLKPEPNTDAEDSAQIDGMQAALSEENNEIYMGIAVKCVDASETLPFISARSEESLEYDLIRAISLVHGGEKKKIRVMTSLPVAGGMGANFQAPPKPQWVFFEQTSKEYDVETIPPSTKKIPGDTATLIVVHPYDIGDEGQFAIDQFLLGGGNVVVLVDPDFYFSRALAGGQPQMPGMPPQQGPPPTSNLDKLFPAWGVKFETAQVLADRSYASEILRPGNVSPIFLTLNESAITADKEDPIAGMLSFLNMLTPGSMDIVPPAGVKFEALVSSSPDNQLVSSFDADPQAEGGTERIRKNFRPSNVRKPLVAMLSGNFKTAFPEGDPSVKEEEAEEAKDEPKESGGEEDDKKEAEKKDDAEKKKEKPVDTSLKNSAKPGRVLIFPDVDFIFDTICVDRRPIAGLGIQMVRPLNHNLALLQNAIESLSGDPDLIHVRSRSTVRRPFTRQNEWLKKAEAKFATQLEEYREKERKAEERLRELIRKSQEQGVDQEIMKKEVQEEVRKLRKESGLFSRQVRELEKEVTRDFKKKQLTFKLANTLIIPFLIIAAGIALALFRRSRTAAR